MGHFAELDENNVVLRVIVAESKELCEEIFGGTWVQTSYNTRGGVHYGPDNMPDDGVALHKNFAGVGYHWDGTGFHQPQPYPSWTLDSDTYLWNPPIPRPTDGPFCVWNESTLSWDEVTNG